MLTLGLCAAQTEPGGVRARANSRDVACKEIKQECPLRVVVIPSVSR